MNLENANILKTFRELIIYQSLTDNQLQTISLWLELKRQSIKSREKEEVKQNLSTLTAREKEILLLVANGNTSMQIADQLFLSRHTVDTHRRKIIEKLELKSIVDWQVYALHVT